MPKYPNVKVKLVGNDGNAFVVLGQVRRALKNAGISEEEIKKFTDQATSGDYDNLLNTCIEWVEVN